jgi:monoamine oxidase
MIRRSLATAAGLLLSERFSFARPQSSAPCVIVIGAGLAGLAAAYELSRADVIVLEARNRAGGRVISFHGYVEGALQSGARVARRIKELGARSWKLEAGS